MCELPTKDFHVTLHWARKHEYDIERPSQALGHGSIRHRTHNEAHIEMSTSHSHVANLVFRLAGQNYVVHQNEHVSNGALLFEYLLLLQQSRN